MKAFAQFVRILKAWDEDKHPRADNGEFGSGSGAGGTATAEKPKREVISSGTSTGDVHKEGNEVIKPSTRKDGSKTLEGQTYEAMKGVPGITPGYERDGEIRTPHYRNVIGVDTIEEKKRHLVAGMIKPNIARINAAVSSLSMEGYDYNDPLQFGLTPEKKMELFDFSNVSKGSPEDAWRENRAALATFYDQFGMKEEGKRVQRVGTVLEGMKAILADDDPLEFWGSEVGENHAAKLKSQLGDQQPESAYYATNGRHIGIKGIAQTEPEGGLKVLLSTRPLTSEEMQQWEITPVFHPAKPKAEKSMTNILNKLKTLRRQQPELGAFRRFVGIVKNVKDDTGHEHDSDNGQFTSGGGGGAKPKDKPEASADAKPDAAKPGEKAKGVLAKLGGKLSELVNRVPVVGKVKRGMEAVMSKIHDTAAQRYGAKTAKAIMASGMVADAVLMGGGALVTGLPVVTGVNQLLGIIPAFVLAEGKYQVGRIMGKSMDLEGKDFDRACKDVAEQIKMAFAELLDTHGDELAMIGEKRATGLFFKRFSRIIGKKADVDMGDETERINLIADILDHVFGDDAVAFFDEGKQEKAWDDASHPRGPNGRFIPKGSPEAAAAAKGEVKATLKGKRTPETHKQLAEHLNLLTVKQLAEIKKEYQISASGRNKAELVAKLAERLSKGRGDGEVPEGESPSYADWGKGERESRKETPEEKPAKPEAAGEKPAEGVKPLHEMTASDALMAGKSHAEWSDAVAHHAYDDDGKIVDQSKLDALKKVALKQYFSNSEIAGKHVVTDKGIPGIVIGFSDDLRYATVKHSDGTETQQFADGLHSLTGKIKNELDKGKYSHLPPKALEYFADIVAKEAVDGGKNISAVLADKGIDSKAAMPIRGQIAAAVDKYRESQKPQASPERQAAMERARQLQAKEQLPSSPEAVGAKPQEGAKGKEAWEMTADEATMLPKNASPTWFNGMSPPRSDWQRFDVKQNDDGTFDVNLVGKDNPQLVQHVSTGKGGPETMDSIWRAGGSWNTNGKEYQDAVTTGHRTAVQSALASGKPVPDAVLADYPDLAAKYGKGEQPAKPAAEKPAESTSSISDRAATDPNLTYADIDAHVETLKGKGKQELLGIAKEVAAFATPKDSRAKIVQAIGDAIKARRENAERTGRNGLGKVGTPEPASKPIHEKLRDIFQPKQVHEFPKGPETKPAPIEEEPSTQPDNPTAAFSRTIPQGGVSYAEIDAHVDSLKGKSKEELARIGQHEDVAAGGKTKQELLEKIRQSLKARKQNAERTGLRAETPVAYPAPKPSPKPDPSTHSPKIAASFDKLNTNGRNFVSIAKLRAEHPELSKDEFDKAVFRLRKEQGFTASALEGRDGASKEELAGAINEGGEKFGYLSRREGWKPKHFVARLRNLFRR